MPVDHHTLNNVQKIMGEPRAAFGHAGYEVTDSVDDLLVLNAGDDSGRSAAAIADLGVYIEHALESLSPSHSGMALCGCADF